MKKLKRRAPSCARLMVQLRIDRATAIKIRRIIHGTLDPATIPDTAHWIRQCYNVPRAHDQRMHAINALLQSHGVACIRADEFHVIAEYCNAGDTYAATILYCHDAGTYRIDSVGDYVERADRRGLNIP